MPKNWCLWTVVLETTPESPLDSKEIKPVYFKGDQPWIFTESTDAEVEAPVFWSSNVNRWFIGKVHDVGKDWEQKKKTLAEDEVSGGHHQCSEHELGQNPGGVSDKLRVRDREALGVVVHGITESDTTERLNNGSFIPSFLSKLHTVLQSGYTNLHSHQKCRRVPFSSHPLHHLLVVDSLMMSTLTVVKWYIIVVLISPSLIINNVENLSMCEAICISS